MRKFLMVRKNGSDAVFLVAVDDIDEIVQHELSVQLFLKGRREPMCLNETYHGPGKSADVMKIMASHTLNFEAIASGSMK